MRLTDEQIAAIRDGTEGVTPGPWRAMRAIDEQWTGTGERRTVPLDAGFINHLCFFATDAPSGAIDEELQIKGWASTQHIARCDPDTIRTLATEVLESRAEIAKMRKALSIWDEAFATGRHEPLVAAWEAARASLGKDAT
jgi:hypothetical protein